MLHIVTINWTTDKWIDIQADSFKEFIKIPYKVYTKLGNMGDDMFKKHSHKFYYCAPGKENEKSHVTIGTKLSLDEIKKDLNPDDIILFIDSDAFLINNLDILIKKLEEYPFVSCQEPQHEIDPTRKIPHPMFLMFKAKTLNEKLYYYLTTIINMGTGTWWDGLIQWMKDNKYEYYPVERSNKINLHPLYFGLYEDIIYHHWAGSRKMITRPDRRLHKQTGESLESIAEKNHKLSNQVYEQILHQKDVFIEYLKGNHNEIEDEN